MKTVRNKLRTQVKHMLEFCNLPAGKEWEYIVNYFGETPLSNWELNGKRTLDRIMIVVAIAVIWAVFQMWWVILGN